ncbi:MAG: lysophospholipase [Caulobacter sp.]|nr:lysophospholipase [Caulobacter sp.]
MKRRAFLASVAVLPLMTACATPMVQRPAKLIDGFQGAGIDGDAFISFDGARLGMTRWPAEGDAEPWAVIVGLHGMNDYSQAFHLAAPWWAKQGIATYAFDQRGFGRSPNRGIWAGQDLIVRDIRTFTALVRARHPNAIITVAGVSMGGSDAIAAFSSNDPPAADRVVLLAPGVWGWSAQPLPYKTALWFTAHTFPGSVVQPPDFVIRESTPSDNREELVAMGRDPLQTFGARPDTMYGLVSLMETAWASVGKIKVPVCYLYGDHDHIIPKAPTWQAASRLKPTDRSAFYKDGWHLLLVDHQRETVWRDVVGFIRDPSAPLVSGAPAIPGAPTAPNKLTA